MDKVKISSYCKADLQEAIDKSYNTIGRYLKESNTIGSYLKENNTISRYLKENDIRLTTPLAFDVMKEFTSAADILDRVENVPTTA